MTGDSIRKESARTGSECFRGRLDWVGVRNCAEKGREGKVSLYGEAVNRGRANKRIL